MLRAEVLSDSYRLPPSGVIELDIINAHRHCINNGDVLLRSAVCGCFWCVAILHWSEIREWTDNVSGVLATAICPRCSIDAVIGTASGYPVERWFLRRMHEHWASPKDISMGIEPPDTRRLRRWRTALHLAREAALTSKDGRTIGEQRER